MSHVLENYLSVSKVTDNPEIILLQLPTGWRSKFQEIVLGLYSIIKVKLTGIDIRDGVLYITFVADNEPKKQLADYVVKTLLQQSAQTCMMCGQYARRRKEQAHKPALCRTHYLEYINSQEE
jgi:hypothetical protein